VPQAGFRLNGESITALACATSGKYIVVGTASGRISLFDTTEKTPTESRMLRGCQGPVLALTFSVDGRFVAGGGKDGTLRVWELRKGSGGEPRAILPGHTKPIRTVAFSPDGQLVGTGSEDTTARLWSLRGIRACQRASFPHAGEVHNVSFSPDGAVLLSAGNDKVIWLWDRNSTKPTARASLTGGHSGNARLALIPPEGQAVISVGEGTEVIDWNLRTYKPRIIWEVPANPAIASRALTPDGRYLARGLTDGSVEVYRVAEKRA
jgi:WD40 repeat protein